MTRGSIISKESINIRGRLGLRRLVVPTKAVQLGWELKSQFGENANNQFFAEATINEVSRWNAPPKEVENNFPCSGIFGLRR